VRAWDADLGGGEALMPLDFTDPVTFEQWEKYFSAALEGTSVSDDHPDAIVKSADLIAQAAVELVQARARESRK
jgi:hypothetical protein